MNGKKIVFLFLALLLPVCVFIFLKFFGRNEFNVPLLYEAGVTEKAAECSNVHYGTPYILPDSIFRLINPKETSLVIVNASETNERVSAKLKEIEMQFEADHVTIQPVSMLKAQAGYIQTCILLLQQPNTIALIDDKKQIRGHYDGNDRDELDRLEAEIKILLKKY
jgi:hypothetical protein